MSLTIFSISANLYTITWYSAQLTQWCYIDIITRDANIFITYPFYNNIFVSKISSNTIIEEKIEEKYEHYIRDMSWNKK
ncbi:hypothetical protein GBBBJNDB_00310 [Pseudomonas phage Callisto]|nr:hypothetical protein GBBBJNDB_00310 [Pseudomonas phage Callisto]WPK40016.1 hypothetical protein ETTORE_0307 [Pseudomonas phage Ettore]